jgi:hypothetical protein
MPRNRQPEGRAVSRAPRAWPRCPERGRCCTRFENAEVGRPLGFVDSALQEEDYYVILRTIVKRTPIVMLSREQTLCKDPSAGARCGAFRPGEKTRIHDFYKTNSCVFRERNQRAAIPTGHGRACRPGLDPGAPPKIGAPQPPERDHPRIKSGGEKPGDVECAAANFARPTA